ncbi:MAG: aldehyde dehydrogenase family protein, partial [Christensenellales bacterium]
MSAGRILYGGQTNAHDQIAPTLLDQIAPDSPLMKDEIFGPLLPILPFTDREQAVGFINARPKPLALYLFSTDKAFTDRVLSGVSFGGGCVNDTIIHLATSHMGFGGVGQSGMGSYHGKTEVDCTGKIVLPGFLDAHIHLESSLVSPTEFVKAVLPHGTTTVVTDPHEITNVMGTDGIEYML